MSILTEKITHDTRNMGKKTKKTPPEAGFNKLQPKQSAQIVNKNEGPFPHRLKYLNHEFESRLFWSCVFQFWLSCLIRFWHLSQKVLPLVARITAWQDSQGFWLVILSFFIATPFLLRIFCLPSAPPLPGLCFGQNKERQVFL